MCSKHWTYTCQKSRDTPAECVNCNEDHVSSYSQCTTYLQKLKALEARRKRPPSRPRMHGKNEAKTKKENRKKTYKPLVFLHFPTLLVPILVSGTRLGEVLENFQRY
ncbi:hypothetical protein JTB14_027271 [Gonioctena quinquepunctata]|nr:hypothetical protein JTB14_027271 [Gonioctena quinquepunctata]